MSASRQVDWTIKRFLSWEACQELRYEFDGVRPMALLPSGSVLSMPETGVALPLDELYANLDLGDPDPDEIV